jgi:hypothetical protein
VQHSDHQARSQELFPEMLRSSPWISVFRGSCRCDLEGNLDPYYRPIVFHCVVVSHCFARCYCPSEIDCWI